MAYREKEQIPAGSGAIDHSLLNGSLIHETPGVNSIAISPQPEFIRTPLKDPRQPEIKTPQEMAWWRKVVAYQIMTRSFYDANGDGAGDLRGITEKADFIKDMGYEAIWLNPIHRSPQKDNGYDVASYFAVDERYGSNKDLQELITEMKKRNIKVFLDLVANHSSDEHPLFRRSRESKDSIVRDVYIWKEGKKGEDGTVEPPNNWLGWFGDGAWEFDEPTSEYYFHKFAIGQPDFNLRNPKVKEYFKRVLHRWLKMGISGVRMDTADIYFEDPTFSDAEPNPDWKEGDSWITRYNVREKYKMEPESNEFLKELMDVLDQYDAVGIGEINSEDLPHVQQLYTDARMHLPFNFNLMHTVTEHGANAAKLKEKLDSYMAVLPEGSCACFALDNHDQYKRLSDKVGKAIRPLTMMQMTLGTEGGSMQFVYYGDDIGMPSGPITEDTMDDVNGKNQGLKFCRDFSRTPMQWDETVNAGFSSNPDSKPWLPVGNPENGHNVNAQLLDTNSQLHLTRNLIKLRKEQPALLAGKYVPFQTPDADTLVFSREADTQKLMILLNFSGERKVLQLPPEMTTSTRMFSTNGDTVKEPTNVATQLDAYEGAILQIIPNSSTQ